MTWLPAVKSSSAALKVTIITVASLIGVSYVAYMLLYEKSRRSKIKRRNQEKFGLNGRWNEPNELHSEIMLRLAEGKLDDTEVLSNKIIFQTHALDMLLVTTEQLGRLLEKILDANILLENDQVLSLKKKIESIELILDGLQRKTDRKKKRPLKHSEKLTDGEIKEQLQISIDKEKNHQADSEVESVASDDSFVSAAESVPDEAEFEQIREYDEETKALILQYGHIEFYNEGIKEYKHVGINVRKLRTDMLGCENDADFMVKVFCIRSAFEVIFQQEDQKQWFLQAGRKMLNEFMATAGKDHIAFEREFDVLVTYCQGQNNWEEIEEELTGRGVCCMSFYDIVLDFVIMDSFDDLDNPPYALTSVIQNGWLSNSIKETALSAAVWSLLTAKIRMLEKPDAFMIKFYQVSQHITPVLVWGFLGPDGKLKNACYSFKELLLGFLRDIFSFNHCKYDSVQNLADDIVKNAKSRIKYDYEEKSEMKGIHH